MILSKHECAVTVKPEKMVAILPPTFCNAFTFVRKVWYFDAVHYSMFLMTGLINNKSALVQIMVWCQSGDKPFSAPLFTEKPYSIWLPVCYNTLQWHHKTIMASQILGNFSYSTVYSTVCSGVHKKNQRPVLLAFVREIHKGPVTWKSSHVQMSSWG